MATTSKFSVFMQYPSKQSIFAILIANFLLIGLLSSCQKDPIELTPVPEATVEETLEVIPPTPKSYPGVDEALWEYFERFEKAGAEQGIEVDLTKAGLTGVIEDLEEENVAGQCNFYSHAPNHVILDAYFWNRTNDNFKEMIVFHELAHCFLERGHREGSLEDGRCISIMRSGAEDCRDGYTQATRAYYLKELFHPDGVN